MSVSETNELLEVCSLSKRTANENVCLLPMPTHALLSPPDITGLNFSAVIAGVTHLC